MTRKARKGSKPSKPSKPSKARKPSKACSATEKAKVHERLAALEAVTRAQSTAIVGLAEHDTKQDELLHAMGRAVQHLGSRAKLPAVPPAKELPAKVKKPRKARRK